MIDLTAAGAPALRPSSAVKYIVDGNSIYANGSGGLPMDIHLAANAYFSGTVAVFAGCAIAGQTWRQMTGLDGGSSADVDAAMDVTKTCVLICAEGTNSIGNAGRTALQAQQDCTDYIAARRAAWLAKGGAAKKLRVVLCGAPPRDGTSGARAASTTEYNNLCAAAYKAMGADVFVNYRIGSSPFNHSGSDPGPFIARQDLWTETTMWLHPNSAGRVIMAQMIIDNGLRRLRA